MAVVAFSNALMISIKAVASRFMGSGEPTTGAGAGAVGAGAGVGVVAVVRVVVVVLLVVSCFEASGEALSALGPPVLVLLPALPSVGSVSNALVGRPS